MINLQEEKLLYSQIQKKLFYIIPEKWNSIYLYASVFPNENKKLTGEMFFYYIPKGIIKRKAVNCYEVPNLFNIDEEQYLMFITEIYNLIKTLYKKNSKRQWTYINITIENFKFKIEYHYEISPFNSYERHVIWRHNFLNEDEELLSKKDRKIIDSYNDYLLIHRLPKAEIYSEGVYNIPSPNIIDFEKTLTVDEAIAQSNGDGIKKKPVKKVKRNKNISEENESDECINNQILNWKK